MSDTQASLVNALPPPLRQRVNQYVLLAHQEFAGGLTWGEFGTLLVELLRLVVAGLDDVTSMTGAAKKSSAVGVATVLFDTFADKCVPMAVYPFWLASRWLIRTLILALAGGMVEALLPITRSSQV